MLPHFRYTLSINAAARGNLINAGELTISGSDSSLLQDSPGWDHTPPSPPLLPPAEVPALEQ